LALLNGVAFQGGLLAPGFSVRNGRGEKMRDRHPVFLTEWTGSQ
jgi:hypothetical protein